MRRMWKSGRRNEFLTTNMSLHYQSAGRDDIEQARTTVADDLGGCNHDTRACNHDTHNWEIPSVTALRTVQSESTTPLALTTSDGESVLLQKVSITSGRPKHGALMSGAHVSGVKATLPIECSCGHRRAILDYSRHHNIAGGYSVTCERCENTIESEEWG